MTDTSFAALPLVDLVLRGGRISTFADADQGPAEVSALAIAQGVVVACGSDEELSSYAAQATRVVELQGRRVIPGLNDSHIHAVRAAASWSASMHWEDARDLAECLDRVRSEASRRQPGEWLAVVGGWHSSQLAEGRGPTRAELDDAAPRNPVYVQELYDRGVLNSAALDACGFRDDSDDPPRGGLLRDAQGRLTGEIRGIGAFAVPTGLALGGADADTGLREMTAEFLRHGLTGVVDGGGLMMTPRDYDPVHRARRRGELGIRMRLFHSAWTRGGEVGDIAALTGIAQPDAGDGMLRLSGVGEIPHLGCHDMEGLDPFELTDESFEELVEIVRLCALRGWRMSIHAVLDATLARILDAWEQVEAETGAVAGRGWSIVHADEASRPQLERIRALGVGILVQNRLVLKGGDYEDAWGAAATADAPPIGDMRELGIPIGAGTDATRANWFSPWASIHWLVTGRSLSGRGGRDARHRMTRTEALAGYTRDAAWFTGEQDHRGRLIPGYDADLCVPTLDPLGCGDDELASIRSDLTIVAGRIAFDSGALA